MKDVRQSKRIETVEEKGGEKEGWRQWRRKRGEGGGRRERWRRK